MGPLPAHLTRYTRPQNHYATLSNSHNSYGTPLNPLLALDSSWNPVGMTDLMSLNCMYEITESMKDSNFSEKLLFIVVDKEDAQYYKGNNTYDMEAGIYDADKRLDYVIHWNNKNKQMDEKLKSADLPYEYITEYTIDKRKLVSIIPSTSQFMNILKDKIGSTFNQIQKDDFKTLKDVIRAK